MTYMLQGTPVLETERLTLRAIGPQDMERGIEFLLTDRIKYMFDPMTKHEAWEHTCKLIGHWSVRGFGLFVICLKGTDDAIGDAALLMPDGYPEREIGWGLWMAEHEGKGIAFEAAQAVRQYAFETLGWDTAVSYIDPENAPSIALAERLGATLDKNAALPPFPDWEGTLVYRRPNPMVVA